MREKYSYSKSITIKDIAVETGYSIATVSRVLNKTGIFYNDATRVKIEEAANRLGYSPHTYAKSLKAQKTNNIAYLIPQLDEFYSSIYIGMQEAARNRDYSVIILSSNFDSLIEENNIKSILGRSYDGLIIATQLINDNHLNRLKETLPIVSIEKFTETADIPYVAIDDEEITKKAVEYLLQLGHNRIAYISAPLDLMTLRDRYNGYLRALMGRGIQADESIVYFTDVLKKTDFQKHYNYMMELLIGKDFSAVMIISDFAAVTAIKAASELGIRIPGDLAIMGFDDIPADEFTIPTISTVSQDKYKLGYESVNMLFDILDDKPVQNLIIEANLKIRGSTGQIKTQ